ncbi:uncharacterized protein LOC107270639 isoform X2 [Cephus cinctus]|nr:uncharacterized protein LOC107270639 isoform X2 [Cephus cinctus]
MPSYRLWGSMDDGNVEFESLTSETLDGALRVIRESFFKNESVCKGVDIIEEPGAMKELEELCLDAAKDGVSAVAIYVPTGQVISVAFNKIQTRPLNSEKSSFELFSQKCKYKSSKALVDFMIDVDSEINLFQHYNVDCILEIMFLATLPDYSKRRIGELVVAASLEIGRELKRGKNVKTPVCINNDDTITNKPLVPSLSSAIMTSNFSKKIALKLGFETLAEVSYDRFEFRGKKFSERIGEADKSCALVAKRLKN